MYFGVIQFGVALKSAVGFRHCYMFFELLCNWANLSKSMQQLIEQQGDLRIRGDILRSARKNRGLDLEALAEAVCLKSWHITQMEDTDEYYFFYSPQLKINAAKKIGRYLELDESAYLY